jgi:tripartite-type tricarboxylate transporter receptor subunit TctC
MRYLRWYTATLIGVFALAASFVSQSAGAQGYPDHPVRLIAPFPPGGAVDAIARTVAQPLAQSLGRPVLVENRAGAGGNVGAEVAARAPADGYTLFLCQSASHAFSPAVYKKLSYDHLRDFAPVSLIGTNTSLLVVHPSMPVKSVSEFIAYAKANPGKVPYASNGVGASGHFTGELFKSMAQVDITHVPYKGGAPALADLLGGQVLVMFSNLTDLLPSVKAGKVRALGVASSKRQPQLPDVPTIAESGVPGFEVYVFFGVCAPAAVPAAVVAKLNSDIVNLLRLPEVKERLAQFGIDVQSSTPGEFGAMIKSETAKWAKVAQAAGISAE